MNQQVGRYKILGKLGRGAMGVVYLAEDPRLNRRVAIKTVELAVDDARNRDFLRDRLVRDGRAAAGLSHPNIVSVYDVLEEGDFGYLVMEYIAGESLATRLARTPLPDTPFIARVLREMASALDYTHARGIIHRDIKPANVMLAADAGGAAKIMDFGIARMSDTRTATPTGMVMGTLEYMAPEQIKGEPVDGRADQFSLAAVAYEMLTGNTLFGEQKFATLAYKIVNEMPLPPRTYNPALPQGVDEVVARALRKPPAERFQTCGGFVAALERAFAGEIPPTGQLTQAMFVPPLSATGAPATAPVVPMAVALPEAPRAPTAQGPAPFASTSPASPAHTTAPLSQMAPAPTAPAAAKLGVLIGITGMLAAMVMGGALLLWKPWAPRAGQPEEHAAVPDLPVPAAGKASDASGTKTTPLPQTSPAPPAKSAPSPTPLTPQPPQGQQPPAQAQVQPSQSRAQPTQAQPQPPQTASSNSTTVEPSKRTPVSASEPANDTAPGTAVPSEPDPGEGPIPQPARAAFREGESLVKSDQYPAAIRQFTKAIDIKRDFLRAYFARGAAYLHLNRPADAFADYAELLRRNPRNAIALTQRGICHSRLHDEDAAMADFNQALEIRPNLPGALNGRGLIFFHRNQYQKALHEFTEAIRISPEFSVAYVNRAHTEEALGNQQAAEADLKKAKELGLAVK